MSLGLNARDLQGRYFSNVNCVGDLTKDWDFMSERKEGLCFIKDLHEASTVTRLRLSSIISRKKNMKIALV